MAPAKGPPDIVVVGAASRDLDAADPRGWRLGGGVTYSSRLLGQLGLSVGALMGLDEEASEAHELAGLRALGVDVRKVSLERGPIFDNRQTSQGRVQIAHSAGDQLPPDALPTAWRESCAYLLNPVAGEIDHGWADALSPTAMVGLGYQGLLRVLRPGQIVRSRPLVPGRLLARADLAGISGEDIRGGDMPLRQLLQRDGQRLVVTEGPRGALHVARSGGRLRLRFIPAVPARVDTDATGAGDTFLAAWLAAVLVSQARATNDSRSLTFASVCASLLVEGGDISCEAIRERMASLKRPAGPESN
ncbi:MAG: PfkB family carbohydrate kinase [Chloroflexota bacterium]|nr:PfkB family carbohydrate kinase [Chloroflexota bacterium]